MEMQNLFLRKGFLIDFVYHKLKYSNIEIADNLEMVGSTCFSGCQMI
jgi:hypothetical protein